MEKTINKQTLIYLLLFFIILLETIIFLFFHFLTFDLEQAAIQLRRNANDSWSCQEYSSYYTKELRKINYDVLVITIPISNDKIDGVIYLYAHQFIIVSSRDGYCKLDKKDIKCIQYSKSS